MRRGKRSGLLASYHGSELLADLRHVLALACNRRGVRQQAIELRDHDLERLDIRFHLGELTTQTDKPPRFDPPEVSMRIKLQRVLVRHARVPFANTVSLHSELTKRWWSVLLCQRRPVAVVVTVAAEAAVAAEVVVAVVVVG